VASKAAKNAGEATASQSLRMNRYRRCWRQWCDYLAYRQMKNQKKVSFFLTTLQKKYALHHSSHIRLITQIGILWDLDI
jgi:hypothetical protein